MTVALAAPGYGESDRTTAARISMKFIFQYITPLFSSIVTLPIA